MVDGSSPPPADALGRLYLGLPFWGHKAWAGRFYTADAKPRDHLEQYASVFNTVEGNTTFYSLPSPESVLRWGNSVPGTFRFSFKLPKRITHELQLVDAEEDLEEFLRRTAPLGSKAGTYLVQLPPYFGPDRLGVLDRFLGACPGGPTFAVEVRHRAFFDDPAVDRRLDELLVHHGAERCWMDTRALRSGDEDHPAVRAARHKKPDVPVRVPAHRAALGRRPLIRFVGHPDGEVTAPWLRRWAGVLVRWLREGRSPYFMVHLPDNDGAPDLAAELYAVVRSELPSLPPLPTFPVDVPREPKGQLSLL